MKQTNVWMQPGVWETRTELFFFNYIQELSEQPTHFSSKLLNHEFFFTCIYYKLWRFVCGICIEEDALFWKLRILQHFQLNFA